MSTLEDLVAQEKANLQSLADKYTAEIKGKQDQVDSNIVAANNYSQAVAGQAQALEDSYIQGNKPAITYTMQDTSKTYLLLLGILLYVLWKKGK